MTVDEPTLMIALGVASITASAMFFTLYASARSIAGVRLWAFGALSVGFAVLLDGPRFIQTWQWASLLFNIPFCAGQVLFLVGTAQFVGRPCARHTLSWLVGIAAALTVVFTLVLPNSVARIISLSVFQAVVNGWTAWLLWRHALSASRRTYRAASLITLVQAAAALSQGFFVAMSSAAITYAAPQLPLANLITWIGTMANVLLGNWILFLLIMLRLVGDLKVMADNDSLTGLLNRRGLRHHIDAVTAPHRHTKSLAVLLLDIDHFKMINDQHGHDTGDRVLTAMGDVMRELSGAHITACRWGGEEFCFVADNFSEDALLALAEKASREFNRITAALLNSTSGATVSIGVAAMEVDDGFEFSRLVGLADGQLYLAKNGGRNRICGAAPQAYPAHSKLTY